MQVLNRPLSSNMIRTGKNLPITSALVSACCDTRLVVNAPPPASAIGNSN